MGNRGLLKTLSECEYPAEFLVSRLLGKKSGLFRSWEFLIISSDAVKSLQDSPFYPSLKRYGAQGIWRFLHNEYLWVYKRMNSQLRIDFQSYFACHEMETLIVCLRYLLAGEETERVRQLLIVSLLHDEIKAILSGSMDFVVMLKALELRLCRYSENFRGLCEHYEKKGGVALEAGMRERFFASILSRKQPPMLKTFVRSLIDFHNCLALAKSLRWQSRQMPVMIHGGSVPPGRFKRAYFRKDMIPVLKSLRLKDADELVSALQKLETVMLCSISRKLKIWSYQRTVVGDILFYLWEQYCYTRNISMILSTSLLDDEKVRGDIVA